MRDRDDPLQIADVLAVLIRTIGGDVATLWRMPFADIRAVCRAHSSGKPQALSPDDLDALIRAFPDAGASRDLSSDPSSEPPSMPTSVTERICDG
ncbi:MAG: phage tail assembly chaperone [Devosiaceae bacterium]|nr:phage tail assembly chaperone [Devosiaceae bacterium MH13]